MARSTKPFLFQAFVSFGCLQIASLECSKDETKSALKATVAIVRSNILKTATNWFDPKTS